MSVYSTVSTREYDRKSSFERSNPPSVQVALRVKPLVHGEGLPGCGCVTVHDNETVSIRKGSKSPAFTFDRVFRGDRNEEEQIFVDMIEPLIEDCCSNGKTTNATIILYGENGSGKTRCLTSTNSGLIPRSLIRIFRVLSFRKAKEERELDYSFDVSIQLVEVLNKEMSDLLLDGAKSTRYDPYELKPADSTDSSRLGVDSSRLAVRGLGTKSPHISGVTNQLVSSVEEVMMLLELGLERRWTVTTSHIILTVQITQRYSHSERTTLINFVELAAPQHQIAPLPKSVEFRERCDINKALMVLGIILVALWTEFKNRLTKKSKEFIPYRDSLITSVLKGSLTGNSKTILIACVSSALDQYEKSVDVLRFANRIKDIHVNQTVMDSLGSIENFTDEESAYLSCNPTSVVSMDRSHISRNTTPNRRLETKKSSAMKLKLDSLNSMVNSLKYPEPSSKKESSPKYRPKRETNKTIRSYNAVDNTAAFFPKTKKDVPRQSTPVKAPIRKNVTEKKIISTITKDTKIVADNNEENNFTISDRKEVDEDYTEMSDFLNDLLDPVDRPSTSDRMLDASDALDDLLVEDLIDNDAIVEIDEVVADDHDLDVDDMLADLLDHTECAENSVSDEMTEFKSKNENENVEIPNEMLENQDLKVCDVLDQEVESDDVDPNSHIISNEGDPELLFHKNDDDDILADILYDSATQQDLETDIAEITSGVEEQTGVGEENQENPPVLSAEVASEVKIDLLNGSNAIDEVDGCVLDADNLLGDILNTSECVETSISDENTKNQSKNENDEDPNKTLENQDFKICDVVEQRIESDVDQNVGAHIVANKDEPEPMCDKNADDDILDDSIARQIREINSFYDNVSGFDEESEVRELQSSEASKPLSNSKEDDVDFASIPETPVASFESDSSQTLTRGSKNPSRIVFHIGDIEDPGLDPKISRKHMLLTRKALRVAVDKSNKSLNSSDRPLIVDIPPLQMNNDDLQRVLKASGLYLNENADFALPSSLFSAEVLSSLSDDDLALHQANQLYRLVGFWECGWKNRGERALVRKQFLTTYLYDGEDTYDYVGFQDKKLAASLNRDTAAEQDSESVHFLPEVSKQVEAKGEVENEFSATINIQNEAVEHSSVSKPEIDIVSNIIVEKQVQRPTEAASNEPVESVEANELVETGEANEQVEAKEQVEAVVASEASEQTEAVEANSPSATCAEDGSSVKFSPESEASPESHVQESTSKSSKSSSKKKKSKKKKVQSETDPSSPNAHEEKATEKDDMHSPDIHKYLAVQESSQTVSTPQKPIEVTKPDVDNTPVREDIAKTLLELEKKRQKELKGKKQSTDKVDDEVEPKRPKETKVKKQSTVRVDDEVAPKRQKETKGKKRSDSDEHGQSTKKETKQQQNFKMEMSPNQKAVEMKPEERSQVHKQSSVEAIAQRPSKKIGKFFKGLFKSKKEDKQTTDDDVSYAHSDTLS